MLRGRRPGRLAPALPRVGFLGAKDPTWLSALDAMGRTPVSARPAEARCTFEKMHTYANHVGLFAEEVGPSGEQLGNFPQAFTHLSPIMAATTPDGALDRPGRTRAASAYTLIPCTCFGSASRP
ncbi:glycoside hydrolase family 15 protein [Streptomyces sp. NPDC058751]|uniref:glycoside hydrolase family 15 protein n=1 Tax=Streptomyces sp. NPDC058751 TaxID=3346623 RepID=UPI00369D6EBD